MEKANKTPRSEAQQTATRENAELGKLFEKDFQNQARFNGLLALKNKLSATHTYGRGVRVVKSELDFTLISRRSGVAFIDCKTFEGERAARSQFNPKQVERAATYNEWGVPSGFVVLFRKTRDIVFYSGELIAKSPRRTSFGREEGAYLGKLELFDLRMIYETARGPLP